MTYSLDFRQKVFSVKMKVVLRLICLGSMAILKKDSVGTQNWHARGRINAIGAIIGMTFLTVSLFNGNVNSDVFYAWLTQDLLPKVPQGSVIVMDNASFHKRNDMIDAIEASHCIVEFLPPYSPDLNPIEHKWAQAKAIRKQHRCSVEELFSIYL